MKPLPCPKPASEQDISQTGTVTVLEWRENVQEPRGFNISFWSKNTVSKLDYTYGFTTP